MLAVIISSKRARSARCVCGAASCQLRAHTATLGMGGALSNFFQSGSALLSAGNHRGISEQTRTKVRDIFDALRANPRITVQRLEGLLSQIPKNENILLEHNDEGYNLLQKCVGLNNVEMVRWILSRNTDVNRGACSLPLHIACLKGYEECVEILLKHGARIDVEARMCWPGPHNQNCEERGKCRVPNESVADRSSDKLQSAVFYAIDGDQADILELLTQQCEDHWLPWQQRRPLLHIACERGAWNCVKYLVSERSDEINQCYDEYYPIHQAALHHIKFLELLINCGAETRVRTATQQMTVLHIVFLIGRKSAEDTLQTCKLLLDHGLRELINEPDSLGNTPLHGLIVRYALEEARYGYDHDNQPWNKWDVLHLVRFLLQNGARPSINHPGNSALACVLRHVRDWEFRYELLNMLLQEGGNPNVVGRDGSVPLMVCLVPLINKDPLHHFTHTMKVCYLNCVRILCKHGANPNCTSRSNLTPMHVLVFTASESIALNREEEKAQNFEFIRNLLVLLLQYGLDPNVQFSQRTQHILQSLSDMVQNARGPSDLMHVYNLTLTLIQYGADPNVVVPDAGQIGRTGCHTGSGSAGGAGRRPQRVGWVLQCYVSAVCRKEELLSDPQQRFARIIWLYYFCMDHTTLFSCLRQLHAQAALVPPRGAALCHLVRELCGKPRTLKQIARVAVYTALGRRPGTHVNKLPLPVTLREYILNFEP
ncbi:ankyrin-1 isoform X1 [Schistocerca serialis cubense]|uniref:ankyrin-1 isoform X1 n=1 Tax=Schistocerca serialis cubense TaxID=2023355 RepID=UPI00214F1CCC|nr:ankyrin-1 isoform X1 [Schistocerca serialis cubense]